MFDSARAFSAFSVDDLDRAEQFYGALLGLDVTKDNEMLLLHVGGGTDVLAYEKEDHTPASFTILNFPVDDIDAAVEELGARGVQLERYEGFDHDANGIVRGEGPPIAWFTDPAGNVISVLEM